MPKTEATCPECGTSSASFEISGTCPACGTKGLPERRPGEVRYNAVQAIERSFRFLGSPGTRAPGTECVDVGSVVDITLSEVALWLEDSIEPLMKLVADELREFISKEEPDD